MCSSVRKTPLPVIFDELISELESLRDSIEKQALMASESLPELPPSRLPSAQNLLHYLALRSRDIRPLQDRLTRMGLSSLGRMEPHVMATINACLHNLHLISRQQEDAGDSLQVYGAFDSAADQLEHNTARLFGKLPPKRRVHIIVTMSVEIAEDNKVIRDLLENGMGCMRINCSHDDSRTWLKMIKTLREAELETGHSCKILMDLGGPKLRLGAMESEPAVIKVKPVRASDGRVQRRAQIWLTGQEAAIPGPPGADACFELSPDWLALLAPGDRVKFKDVRGSKRTWRIREVCEGGCWAESKKTCYLANGTTLKLKRAKPDHDKKTRINSLADVESICRVRPGDILYIDETDKAGKPAVHDARGELITPGRVSLNIPEVFRDVSVGDPVFFDDGRISGLVEEQSEKQLRLRILRTTKPVEKLEGGRGLNLPDSHLALGALSETDIRDIDFVVRHADLVGLSFANDPADVRALYRQLEKRGRPDIGVILKIETKRGFSNLPAMLLEALKFQACGVMIARGDLAVECGFERMSEIQEEILWVCESAHIPVIWATQVLEGLTKRGQATRAEVTDAAMSQAAEAVMLNKGAYINEAVKMLDNILQRMQGHHCKKRSLLRKLHLASEFNSSLDNTCQ